MTVKTLCAWMLLGIVSVVAMHQEVSVDEIVPEAADDNARQLVEQLVPEAGLYSQQTSLYEKLLAKPYHPKRKHTLVAPLVEIQEGAGSGSAEVRHWAKFDARKVWEKELLLPSGGEHIDHENALRLKAYAITAVEHAFEVMKMNTRTLSSLGYLLITIAGYGQQDTQDKCQPGASGISTPLSRASALYDFDMEDSMEKSRGDKEDVTTQYQTVMGIVGKRFRFANSGSIGPYILTHIAKAMATKDGIFRMHKRTKIRLSAESLGLTDELQVLSQLAVPYHDFVSNMNELEKDPCYSKFYELPTTTHEKAQVAIDMAAESAYKVEQEAKYKEGKVKARLAEARQKAEEAAGKEAKKKAEEAAMKLAEKQAKEANVKAIQAEKDAKADVAEAAEKKAAALAERSQKADQERTAKELAASLAEAEAAAKASASEEEKTKESNAKKTAEELHTKAEEEEKKQKEAGEKTAEVSAKAEKKEQKHKAEMSAEAAAKQDEADAKTIAAEKSQKAISAEEDYKADAKEKKEKAAAAAAQEQDDKAKAAEAEKRAKQAQKLKELKQKEQEQDAKDEAAEASSKSEEAADKESATKKAAEESTNKHEIAAKAAAEQEAQAKKDAQDEIDAKVAAIAAEAKKKSAAEAKFKAAEAERKDKADAAQEAATKAADAAQEAQVKAEESQAKKEAAAEKNEKAQEEDSEKRKAEADSKEAAKKKQEEAYSKAGEKAGKELKAKAESQELQDKAAKEGDEKEVAKKSATEKTEKEAAAAKAEADTKAATKEAAEKAEAAKEAKDKADAKAEAGNKAKETAEKKESATKKAEKEAKAEKKEATAKKTAEEVASKEADAKLVAKQLKAEKAEKAVEKEKADKAEKVAKESDAKAQEKADKEAAYKEANAKEASRESSAKLRIQCAVAGPGVVPGRAQGCVFPFEFNGQMHDRCITEGQGDGKPWCAIATSRRGAFLTGKWGYCGDCPGALNSTEIIYSYALKVETGTLRHSESTQLPKILLTGDNGEEFELDKMKLPHEGATRIIPFYTTKNIGTVEKVQLKATSADPWFFTNFMVQSGFYGKWVPFGPSNWWLVQRPFGDAASYPGDGHSDSLRLTKTPQGAVGKLPPCDEHTEILGDVCNPWSFGQTAEGDLAFFFKNKAQVMVNKDGDLWSKHSKGYMATVAVNNHAVVSPGYPLATDQVAGDWVMGESSNGHFGLWLHSGDKFLPKFVVCNHGDIYTAAEPTLPMVARNQKPENIGMPRRNAATTPSKNGWQIGVAAAGTGFLGIWKHGVLKAFITSDGDVWGSGAGGYMKQSTFTSENPGALVEAFNLPELSATEDTGAEDPDAGGEGSAPEAAESVAGNGAGSAEVAQPENESEDGVMKVIDDVFK